MKRDGGKQIAVLGHRNRRHLQLRRAIEQLADAARAVQQRELGVQMEVDELSHLDKTLAVLGAECEVLRAGANCISHPHAAHST